MENIEIKHITGCAESRIGGRKENQDSYDWAETPWGAVFTVCDGMGGGPAGKTASSIAVDEILAYMMQEHEDMGLSQAVEEAVRRANIAVFEKANANPEMQGMGTTCTVLAFEHGEAVIAHVGDSRVYQLRGRHKRFRTFDHSMVFELVRQNVITEEQARVSAQSNVITRALGLAEDVDIDIDLVKYKEGDRFMLSTDGIHGALPEKELIDYIGDKEESVDAIVAEVADKVNAIGEEKGGGHDNNTLVLLEVTSGGYSQGWFKSIWKRLFVLVAVLSVVNALSAQSVEWKLAPQYSRLLPYSGQTWKAYTNRKVQLIDIDTKAALTQKHDSITQSAGGHALGLTKDNSQWRIASIINLSTGQETAVSGEWYAVRNSFFSDGIVAAANKKGLQGFLNTKGANVIKPKYESVGFYKNGCVAVTLKKGKTMFVDGLGKKIANVSRDETELRHTVMSEHQFVPVDTAYTVFSEGGAFGYRKDKKEVVVPQFEEAFPFYGAYAPVVKHGKVGLIQLVGTPFKVSMKTVKTKATKRRPATTQEYLVVESEAQLDTTLLRVVQDNGDGQEAVELSLEKVEDNAYSFKLKPRQENTVAQVYYNILLQNVKQLSKKVEKVAEKPKTEDTKATLSVTGVSKRGAKADKNDNEYVIAQVTNTSNVKFDGSATIFVDGKAYPSKISLRPKQSQTIVATVKVKSERYANVYVQLSNGYKTAVKKINLKPFY